MRWSKLFDAIGRQPLSFTQKEHVYAVLWNEQTGRNERVYLTIKYDACGCPYLVKDDKV